MPVVQVEGHGAPFEARVDATLLEVCEDHGVAIEAACGGFAACNTCRVRVIVGELSPKDDAEDPFLDAPDQRLACQARVVADVVVALDPG